MIQLDGFNTIIIYFGGEGAWITAFDIQPEEFTMIERWLPFIARNIKEGI